MDFEALANQLKIDEGFRSMPYRCSAGDWTQGYGRNLESHMSQAELDDYLARPTLLTPQTAMRWLLEDIATAYLGAKDLFPKLDEYTDRRQQALVNMVFNLGVSRLRSFKRFCIAVNCQSWDHAGKEMIDSRWYRQVGDRAKRLVRMVVEG
jgi:lysozyme